LYCIDCIRLILRKGACGAGCAIGSGPGARTFLRGTRDRTVNAERLPEPENSQKDHEHQRQHGGGFRNLGSAALGGKPSENCSE
jgi:hypothetical protein